MTVTDVGYVVYAVQDLISVLLEKVLTFSVEKFQRMVRVGESHHRIEGLFSLGDDAVQFLEIIWIEW